MGFGAALTAIKALTKLKVPVWLPWLLLALLAQQLATHWLVYSRGRTDGAADVQVTLEKERTKAARARTDAALELAQAEAAAREKENRLHFELMQATTHANQITESARADLVAAADAGDRLHQRAEQLAAQCRAALDDTAAAYSRDAADASSRMLTHMLRRVEEHGRAVVGFADSAHIAGSACERDYNAVRAASVALQAQF